jgi:putative peptide zinc metalloprotease protein
MDSPYAEYHLERRKQVRIRLRPDLIILPQRFEGRTSYVVKDPVSLRYYRFQAREHFLLSLMNGRNTLEDIHKNFENYFRPERLSLEDVEAFARHLLTAGLAYHDWPKTGRQILAQRQRGCRQQRLQALVNFLCIPLPLCDPDRWLARLLPLLVWIFTPGFVFLSASFILSGFLLVAHHFQDFHNQLPSAQEFFTYQNAAYLGLAWAGVKMLHELGHGLTCKAFGGEVHEMGVLLLFLCPCFYCDVSDTWAQPNKWKRMAVGCAGIYVEWIIAALATFLWWHTDNGAFLHQLSLNLILVCGISTLVFNLNPLLRFDGYHMLADWLEIPNLRDCSDSLLRNLLLRFCLGIETVSQRRIPPLRQFWLVIYGAASFLYRWLITVGILSFLYSFLRPFHMDAIGAVLAVGIGCILISRSLYRTGEIIYQNGRGLKVKMGRVIVSSGLVAALLIACFLPLPISRIHRTGLVQLEPEATERVFVAFSATLERLYVHDGQHVEKGELLAEFRSLALENDQSDAQCQHDIFQIQTRSLQAQLSRAMDPREQARLQVRLSSASAEQFRFAHKTALCSQVIKRLQIRAPRIGIVMGPPSIDDIGRLWAKDQEQPFCTIGDLRLLRALVPVSPADYHLLQEDLRADPDLRVTIRVPGTEGQTWSGRLAALPESEAKDVPIQLTTRCGGPLAVKPASRTDMLVPQTQQYLLVVKFLETDPNIYAGGLAQVKIHCRPRSTAWWLWRAFNSTLHW